VATEACDAVSGNYELSGTAMAVILQYVNATTRLADHWLALAGQSDERTWDFASEPQQTHIPSGLLHYTTLELFRVA